MSYDNQPLANQQDFELTGPIASVLSKSESFNSGVDQLINFSRSVPNSSKKRYQENYTRRRSRACSLYDHSTTRGGDGFDVATPSVRFSNENLVDSNLTFGGGGNPMTFPRPIARINVTRAASGSSDVTEPITEASEQQQQQLPDPHARLRPSIITLFGRMVSRNNSNAGSGGDSEEVGIRARILRAFSYVGKGFGTH